MTLRVRSFAADVRAAAADPFVVLTMLALFASVGVFGYGLVTDSVGLMLLSILLGIAGVAFAVRSLHNKWRAEAAWSRSRQMQVRSDEHADEVVEQFADFLDTVSPADFDRR